MNAYEIGFQVGIKTASLKPPWDDPGPIEPSVHEQARIEMAKRDALPPLEWDPRLLGAIGGGLLGGLVGKMSDIDWEPTPEEMEYRVIKHPETGALLRVPIPPQERPFYKRMPAWAMGALGGTGLGTLWGQNVMNASYEPRNYE